MTYLCLQGTLDEVFPQPLGILSTTKDTVAPVAPLYEDLLHSTTRALDKSPCQHVDHFVR
jgi:hypothetical protein